MREIQMCRVCHFWEQDLDDGRYGTCVSTYSRYGTQQRDTISIVKSLPTEIT